ncbi:hypothetical protein Q427_20485 [Halomonas sp. BC04]|nr:hypothetical protein Q427_20485 [Halomonas sp. BC04]
MIAALADAAQDADLVITSGGVSVGEADQVRAALAAVGELGFWKIAIRPGRPLACGRLGAQGTPFLGLPGNPVAAMVTFLQFVAPMLRQLQGCPNTGPLSAHGPGGVRPAKPEGARRFPAGRLSLRSPRAAPRPQHWPPGVWHSLFHGGRQLFDRDYRRLRDHCAG